MELLTLIDKGTPFLVLGILLFLERINTKLKTVQEDVQDIKNGITWKDTCDERHEEIERRIKNLERETGLDGSKK